MAFNDVKPTFNYQKEKIDFEEDGLERIKIGSIVLLQKEDSEQTTKYILVENFDNVFDNQNYITPQNPLARILLNKTEWDFIEFNGNAYQIIQVINE